jgi:hypothetical protein
LIEEGQSKGTMVDRFSEFARFEAFVRYSIWNSFTYRLGEWAFFQSDHCFLSIRRTSARTSAKEYCSSCQEYCVDKRLHRPVLLFVQPRQLYT